VILKGGLWLAYRVTKTATYAEKRGAGTGSDAMNRLSERLNVNEQDGMKAVVSMVGIRRMIRMKNVHLSRRMKSVN